MSQLPDRVVIGMDPHKRSATIEVMSADETILGGGRFDTDRDGYAAMASYGRRWPNRVGAIEGCAGHRQAHRHPSARPGEEVVDVSDLERIYVRNKAANQELTELVAATGTGLLDLNGIGPSGAARLLVEVGDITRFPTKAHFASWNGTAPIDASSGDQVRHRLSRAGNRQINRVLHIMARVQLRNPTEGRAYYDRKKADGKALMEAMRCVKRRLSDIVYQQMLNDALATTPRTGPRGHRGNGSDSCATSSHPHAGSSEKSLPGPANNKTRTRLPSAS
jgi:transposase